MDNVKNGLAYLKKNYEGHSGRPRIERRGEHLDLRGRECQQGGEEISYVYSARHMISMIVRG